MSSLYEKALQSGYSEKEINDYLSKKDPRYQKALESGYSPQEISTYFSKKQGSQETLPENLNRQFLRSGLRATETALGAPRAFGEFLEGLIPEKLITKGAEKIGLKEPVEKGFEFAKKYAPYKLFPKNEDVRKVSDVLFKRASKPKNEWEAQADEVVSDFAALTLPLPGSKIKPLKAGLLALGANGVSEGIGHLGGTEKEKAYGKMGAILLGSMINPKAAETLKNDLYSKARSARPENASISSKNLIKNSEKFEKELQKGIEVTSKKKSLDVLKEIKEKSSSGNVEISQLEEFKRNINELRSGLYEEFKSDKVGRKAAKRNLDSVSKIIDKSLDEYGKVNPEWEAFYRPANEVHGAIAQSKKVSNWIGRHSQKIGYGALLGELGLLHLGGVGAAIATAKGAGVGFAALKGSEIASRFMKSPTLRKHYINLINNATKEDIVAVRESLKKIQEELD